MFNYRGISPMIWKLVRDIAALARVWTTTRVSTIQLTIECSYINKPRLMDSKHITSFLNCKIVSLTIQSIRWQELKTINQKLFPCLCVMLVRLFLLIHSILRCGVCIYQDVYGAKKMSHPSPCWEWLYSTVTVRIRAQLVFWFMVASFGIAVKHVWIFMLIKLVFMMLSMLRYEVCIFGWIIWCGERE